MPFLILCNKNLNCTAVSTVHSVKKHEAWTTTTVSLVFNLGFILSLKVKMCFGLFKLSHSLNEGDYLSQILLIHNLLAVFFFIVINNNN